MLFDKSYIFKINYRIRVAVLKPVTPVEITNF